MKIRKILFLLSLVLGNGLFAAPNESAKSAFLVKIDHDIAIKKQQIVESLAKIETLTNDLAHFRTTYNSISAPAERIVTNRYSKTAYSTRKVKVSLNERRQMRMKKALENKVLNDLYVKYLGESLKGVAKSYEDEIQMAEENRAITMKNLKETKTRYTNKVRKLERDRQSEFRAEMKKYDERIRELETARKRQCQVNRSSTRMLVICSRRGQCCSNCREAFKEIDEVLLEQRATKKIYDSGKWSNSRSDLVSEKSELADVHLAEADYRTAQQSIYMVFKEKILGAFLNKLDDNIKAESANVVKLGKEIAMLQAVQSNPDMVSADMVEKINSKNFDAAVKGLFGVDKDGFTEEDHARLERARAEQRELQREQAERDARERMAKADREAFERSIDKAVLLRRKELELEQQKVNVVRQHVENERKRLDKAKVIIVKPDDE